MPPRDYQPGELVPGTVYRIVRPIGAGGMGTVYEVEDTTIEKRYVLKTLHPRLGSREDLARRMQNEARTLARLHHPNIVEVITAGVTADDLRLPFFVMERLDGQSLRLVLEKRGRLELPHAYNLTIDLLDALDHAHDRGIVHRDVKPDNIFLHRSPSGSTVTKLLDFGIVALLDHAENETSGRFFGTLRYAAPEQLRGEKPTRKTDVYAVALVLFEILAGRGPFDDEREPQRISQAHLHRRPPPIANFARVPSELNGLVMAALDKDPDVRPRDAFSFAASLRNIKRAYPEMPSVPPPASADATAAAAVESRPTAIVRAAELDAITAFEPVEAAASTSSAVAIGEPKAGRGSTPPLPETARPSPADGAGPAGPEEWPTERSPALSEEPQIRSLPAASLPRRSRGMVAIVCSAAVGLGALGLVTRRASHGPTSSAAHEESSLGPLSGDDPPEPVVAIVPAIAFSLPERAASPPAPRRHGAGIAASSNAPAFPAKARGRGSAPKSGRPGPGF